jgi:dihydrolipoamide dehydrogenase
VDVTIIELLPRILPREDEEISKELTKELTKVGIKIKTGVKFESIAVAGKSVKVKLPDETLEVDQVLVAAAFSPNSKGLGLETAGVKVSDRGMIEVNEKMQTNIPGIWAIGDVTGKLMLAHVGSAMGIICAENIAGVETITLDYEMMPRATYCHPQVASFGLTEAQAKERGYNIKIGRFPFQANGKALGLGDYAGFVKIVMDEKYGEILGAHMIGPEVTELLPELTLARMMELTPHEIARNVHAHPTLSEVLMEAAHGAEGSPIHI